MSDIDSIGRRTDLRVAGAPLVRDVRPPRRPTARGSDMADHIEVNGAKLWYEIAGEGEPVLQIHGSGFGHFNFGPGTPILSKQFRCIDYDQRGYGQSEKPEQDYDLDVWADD